MGSFDQTFLGVPPEILQTSMRVNQKYFALRDPKTGKLANRFLVVANMVASDGGKEIVAGNERVLRARLADAKFFWDQDRKTKLADRVDALKGIVFHAKLGTQFERVQRIVQLAGEIAGKIGADVEKAKRAALLCKADLTTGVVGEFPELQGIMGGYYAAHDGEDPEVAAAIRDHYKPLGPTDTVPTAKVSIAVALADKLDQLAGFFAAGEKPTGSADPFALRRAALGVIRILLENGLRLPLTVKDDVIAFFADRLKVALKEKGTRHDLIDAVFSLGGEDDLVRLVARVEALQDFIGTDNGKNLIVAYKRAANILKAEEKKDKKTYDGAPDTTLLNLPEEKELFVDLMGAAQAIRTELAAERFVEAMRAMARLRRPVDDFFEKVTVNDKDPALRESRLKLLSALRTTMHLAADFSKIEG
jgi:glycyl-tRNA synthetase beta chain